jgi:ribosomal protein S18 acetylase RimI-like enzyme
VTVELIDRVPSPEEYLALRLSAGWHALPKPAVKTGLHNSLYAVCAVSEERVVGCGRISGDGGIYFYIQDLIVRPNFQRRGLGTRLMDRLMAYVHQHAQNGAFIGLMAAPGLAGFYERFGFSVYPEDSPGMLIWK